ncbi:MAG: hypothetical protein WBH98_06480 [Bacteroidales bacterium]
MTLVEKFFKMEEECDLFSIKTEDGLPLWDIIRMHVYLKYHFPEITQPDVMEQNKLTKIWQHLLGLSKSIFYMLTKKSDNLILPTSRYRDSNGLYFDKAAMNVIEYFGKNCFIIEWHDNNKKYRYQSANNYVSILQKFRKKRVELDKTSYNFIEETLKKYLNKCRVTYNEINDVLETFRSEYYSYSKLLKLKKFKRIFITQNGLQKGLIKAAINSKIKVYEFQHGSFEKDHLTYSYPKMINCNSNIIFPDYLLTYSDYWGSYFNVPAKKVIPIGNDYFNIKIEGKSNDENILVISSMIHGHELAPLTIELAKIYPEKNFTFKLHSNEYRMVDLYRKQFSEFNNITLITNETSIPELLSECELVILINSTVIYETLNQNKKVVIFKRGNYFIPHNNNQFVNLFYLDISEDLNEILNTKINKTYSTFFKPFDLELFLSVL